MNSVDLSNYLSQIENTPPNTVLNYGLKINSTEPVFAYYEVASTYCNCNPEIFALKGKNALGTEFYIPMQHFLDNGSAYFPTPYSSFDIIATESNTTIQINPSNDVVGHVAGVPFIITLNKGETFSVTAASNSASLHLQGSYVVSDKNIAITMKDDLLNGAPYGGCADLGGDQIIPVTMIGNEYIAVRGFLNPPYDKIFLLATQNSTQISVNGALFTTLNAGQSVQYDIGANPAAYFQSSAPIYVTQLSGYGCEIGLSVLPSVECTGSNSVSFARSSTQDLQVTLLVQSTGINNFLFNDIPGIINASSFSNVPGTNGLWQYALLSFDITQVPVGGIGKISNTSDVFHLGLIHGDPTGGCRFGYFSDYARYHFSINASSDSVCVGQSATLSANSLSGASYNWTGPNGFTDNNQSTILSSVSLSSEGWYNVSGNIGSCSVESDSVFLNVNPNPQIIISGDSLLCFNDTFQLYASGASQYSWSGPNNFYANGQTISIQINSDSLTGVYTVVGTDVNGCIDSTETQVSLFVPASITTNSNSPICIGDSIVLSVSGGNSYLWSGPNQFSTTDSVILISDATILNEGVYTIESIDSNNCTTLDTLIISINPLPNVFASNNGPVISGSDAALYASGGNNYFWFHDNNIFSYSQNPVISPASESDAGYYLVVVTNEFGCSDTTSTNLEIIPFLNFFNVITPNQDGHNDCFIIENGQMIHNSLIIYNRWGKVIFESVDYQNNWSPDGISDGTYFYVFRYGTNLEKEYLGTITVIEK
ncbi:MAG TPA: gliding motility-associated C-terminal domain-containing protein [Bacteroidales bacterium]|nr:gliding motility-associated C-terminal domain-containing protein [Bacteroidales bacterium]